MGRKRNRVRRLVTQIVAALAVVSFMIATIVLVFGGTTGTNCGGSVNYWNCSAYGCLIIVDRQGAPKAIFDGGGFIDLKGTITPSSIGSPDGNDFIIRNLTDADVAWIDNQTGNMRLRGTINDDTKTTCSPPSGSWIIYNRSDACVAYVDKNGNIWSRGRICYNARI